MSSIQLLTLKNFATVREAEYNLGKFNLVSGKNAQGKTTILSALRYLFNGGNEAELVTTGEKTGEVGLVLDNGAKARRRVAPESKSTKFSLTDEHGFSGHGVAEWKRRFDLVSIDPMQFLRAKNEEQTRILLASMPLKLTDEEVRKATGYNDVTVGAEHPMTALKRIHDGFFTARTDVNRQVKHTEIHLKELEATLPLGLEGMDDPSAEVERLEQERRAIEERRLMRKEQIQAASSASLSTLDEERRRRMQEISDWYEFEKENIRRNREAEVQAMMQKSEQAYAPLTEQIAGLRANLENVTIWKSTKLTIDRTRVDLEAIKAEQAKLNAALDGLQALTDTLMTTLPVKGLEIKDGVIYVGGTSINQLSQSESLRFAVRISVMRLGDVRAVIVDSGECMDSTAFAELLQICADDDVQLIVTMVTDEDEVSLVASDDPKVILGERSRRKAATSEKIAA